MSVRPVALLTLPFYLAGQVAKFGRTPMKAALAPHGVVLPQYALLTALEEFGPCSQQELAQRLELDKSNVVKLLDELEEGGLVERSPSPADRRRHGVSITTGGRKLVREVNATAAGRQEELLAATLSKTERDQLVWLLRRVVEDHDAARFD